MVLKISFVTTKPHHHMRTLSREQLNKTNKREAFVRPEVTSRILSSKCLEKTHLCKSLLHGKSLACKSYYLTKRQEFNFLLNFWANDYWVRNTCIELLWQTFIKTIFGHKNLIMSCLEILIYKEGKFLKNAGCLLFWPAYPEI